MAGGLVRVTACGRIGMHRKRINLSRVLAGQRVGIEEVDEGYDLRYVPSPMCSGRTVDCLAE